MRLSSIACLHSPDLPWHFKAGWQLTTNWQNKATMRAVLDFVTQKDGHLQDKHLKTTDVMHALT
jgi:hypothetical protein